MSLLMEAAEHSCSAALFFGFGAGFTELLTLQRRGAPPLLLWRRP